MPLAACLGPPRPPAPRAAAGVDPARRAFLKETQQLQRMSGVNSPLPNGWALYEHQRRAVARILASRRLILALEMGLGKTVVSLVAARAHARAFGRRIVVLSPLSVCPVWRAEAASVGVDDPRLTFLHTWSKCPSPDALLRGFAAADAERGGPAAEWDVRTGAIRGATPCMRACGGGAAVGADSPPCAAAGDAEGPSPKRRRTAAPGPASPSAARPRMPPGACVALSREFVLIADEAHYMQNLASRRTKAVLQLARHPGCRGVVLATGTPMKNGRPVNLFPLLVAVRNPLGRDRIRYECRYCERREIPGRGAVVSGAAHLEELHERIAPNMLRMTKADCLDLPPKVDRLLAHTAPYKQAEATLTRLGATGTRGLELHEITKLREQCSLAKVQAAVDEAEAALERGEKVVIFASFLEAIRQLRERLERYGVCTITAAVKPEQREHVVRRFQDGDAMVFLATFRAGGVGITLTRARIVILVDRPWTPGDTVQAEDRCHRLSQTREVTCIWLQCFAFDRAVDRLLEKKQSTIVRVLAEGAEEGTSFDLPPGAAGGERAAPSFGAVPSAVARGADAFSVMMRNRGTPAPNPAEDKIVAMAAKALKDNDKGPDAPTPVVALFNVAPDGE